MEDQTREREEDPSASRAVSTASSQTLSPREGRSENPSMDEKETSWSESEPDPAGHVCNGLATGCFYYGHDHCHFNCSPRACEQCSEVLDPEYLDKGRWLEDCVPENWSNEAEERSGDKDIPARTGSRTESKKNKVFVMGVLAASAVGFLYCAWQARASWGLLQGWAAEWAQL